MFPPWLTVPVEVVELEWRLDSTASLYPKYLSINILSITLPSGNLPKAFLVTLPPVPKIWAVLLTSIMVYPLPSNSYVITGWVLTNSSNSLPANPFAALKSIPLKSSSGFLFKK